MHEGAVVWSKIPGTGTYRLLGGASSYEKMAAFRGFARGALPRTTAAGVFFPAGPQILFASTGAFSSSSRYWTGSSEVIAFFPWVLVHLRPCVPSRNGVYVSPSPVDFPVIKPCWPSKLGFWDLLLLLWSAGWGPDTYEPARTWI